MQVRREEVVCRVHAARRRHMLAGNAWHRCVAKRHGMSAQTRSPPRHPYELSRMRAQQRATVFPPPPPLLLLPLPPPFSRQRPLFACAFCLLPPHEKDACAVRCCCRLRPGRHERPARGCSHGSAQIASIAAPCCAYFASFTQCHPQDAAVAAAAQRSRMANDVSPQGTATPARAAVVHEEAHEPDGCRCAFTDAAVWWSAAKVRPARNEPARSGESPHARPVEKTGTPPGVARRARGHAMRR